MPGRLLDEVEQHLGIAGVEPCHAAQGEGVRGTEPVDPDLELFIDGRHPAEVDELAQDVGGLAHAGDALHGHQVQHVEDVGPARADLERPLHVGLQAGLEQMRRRRVERHVDQLHHAFAQRPRARGMAGVARVVLHEAGAGVEHGLGPGAPIAALGHEVRLDPRAFGIAHRGVPGAAALQTSV